MKLDTEIDRLYGLPLDEFVGERDALAKRLRKDDDREAGDRVKALRKPTAGAWALNQAVRRRKRERDKLLAAGKRLRKAHEALLSGGDPAPLRKAMAAERELAGSLADTAEAIATETGKGGSALRDRVRGTLHAAALDEEVREELAAGRVVRERDAVGLGGFGAATASAPARADRRERGDRKRTKGERGDTSKRSRDETKRGSGDKRSRSAPDRRRAQAPRERAKRDQAKRDQAAKLAAAERSLAAAHAALAKAEKAHDEAAVGLDAKRRAFDDAQAAERAARAAKRERSKEVAKREREVKRLRDGDRRRG